eukprot:GILJ01001796.1.p1 GENE.GILJ01001796.1~~GILJ01001796.1.p1  ORF type:complete len:298 (-),score=36.20 GILJ01001796.1:96-989(-)
MFVRVTLLSVLLVLLDDVSASNFKAPTDLCEGKTLKSIVSFDLRADFRGAHFLLPGSDLNVNGTIRVNESLWNASGWEFASLSIEYRSPVILSAPNAGYGNGGYMVVLKSPFEGLSSGLFQTQFHISNFSAGTYYASAQSTFLVAGVLCQTRWSTREIEGDIKFEVENDEFHSDIIAPSLLSVQTTKRVYQYGENITLRVLALDKSGIDLNDCHVIFQGYSFGSVLEHACIWFSAGQSWYEVHIPVVGIEHSESFGLVTMNIRDKAGNILFGPKVPFALFEAVSIDVVVPSSRLDLM